MQGEIISDLIEKCTLLLVESYAKEPKCGSKYHRHHFQKAVK